jgi:peptidoglycan hydrolase CwlO-like protein
MAECNNTMSKDCNGKGCDVTYIGSKYVMTFSDPLLWNSMMTYEPLVVVQDEQENSYVSKGYVPMGIPLTNSKYWIKIYTFNVQIENISQRVAITEEDIEALETKTDNTNTAVTNLTARVTTNEADISSLETKTDNTNTAVTNLTARVTTNEADISSLETKTDNTNTAVTDLTTRVTTNEADISDLETKTDNTNTAVTNLTARVTTNEADISSLETKTDNTNTTVTDLTTRVTTNEADISSLETKTDNTNTAVTSLESFRISSQILTPPVGITGTMTSVKLPANPSPSGLAVNNYSIIIITGTATTPSTGYLSIDFTEAATMIDTNYGITLTPLDSSTGGDITGKYRYGVKSKTINSFDIYAYDDTNTLVTNNIINFNLTINGISNI